MRRLSEADFRRLAAWRYALRRFLRFSESAARAAGLSPSQHQLLLFVRGFAQRPNIAELAERLQLRHQSTVGLVDRCQEAGLLRRRRDADDRRRVRVELTAKARRVLERLAREHLRELESLRRAFPLRTAEPHRAGRRPRRRPTRKGR